MRVAPCTQCRHFEDTLDEDNDLGMDIIHTKSHFNCIKMHLLSYFSDHIRQFGNIPLYSSEFGDLAHKEEIKDRWRRSNKKDVKRQILHSYGRQHAIQIRHFGLNSL